MGTHHTPFILLLSFFLGLQQFVQARPGGLALPTAPKPNKLFVFGDSYADTGNEDFTVASWIYPYGITYPGHPSGRWSNGHVFTDYLAEYLGIRSPIPYTLWSFLEKYSSDINVEQCWTDYPKFGMNFAYGGTGVFVGPGTTPNMTVQIDFLQTILNSSYYTEAELESSMAYLSLAGNDYAVTTNFTALEELSEVIVTQLAINMKRIYDLGIKKVAVNSLEPLGCLPEDSVAYEACNSTINILAELHNGYLEEAVAELNAETNGTDNFVILPLNTAFFTVFNSSVFATPYQPCCAGIGAYVCGSVEEGEEMFTLCEDPDSSFYWDFAHPTQKGWEEVVATAVMQSGLEKLSLPDKMGRFSDV